MHLHLDINGTLLYSFLTSLGDAYPLKLNIHVNALEEELKFFAGAWKAYNPRKPEYKRDGLSLTSLDGGLTGVPDLDSIREYNLENGTTLGETDFSKLTTVYERCPSLHGLVNYFQGFVARSHFLRFGKGGFFPPHRDGYATRENVFRILVPCFGCRSSDYVFLLDGERVWMEAGVPYVINTRLEHSLFSFHDDCTFLLMNIRLTEDSLEKVMKVLAAR